ncbi:protein siel [Phtheirospermum japonicum]|uniref:Protein siel n=1 Tax=Phtheirospermum japonicum TaxID=374723 RepID=A0A830C0Z8_9LAMI|nr:protein siel [Phtheirospermum japonicum]
MEHRLLSDVGRALDQNPRFSSKSADAIISLITNPFTSDRSLNSLVETLTLHLQNPNSDHNKILSLLSASFPPRPRLRHRISAAANAFILLPSSPTPSIRHALTLTDPARVHTSRPVFQTSSLFLSLCFWPCLGIRRWILRNGTRIWMVWTMLSDGIVVEDRSLVGGCYFRAVELLFDAENSVRRSAVRAVSKWGQLLVALSSDEVQRDMSDALFVQLCLMVRDTDMEIRVAAFNAIGKIHSVSEVILLQTLSKKALLAIKEKAYPGQYTAKLFKLPATTAAFAFIHGLEDEFHQVRRSACHALQKLMVLSAEFAGGAVHILMDMLNDYSVVVRLQALEALHNMAMLGHLKVEESHLHMFFGALADNNALIRSAARKTIELTKLQKLAMFRSCIDGLIKNLKLYPQDEADIFLVLFKIGQTHGKFVIKIIHEVSQELEPSFDGKLVFNKVRTAALLVLAISAPVSIERHISSIPPQLFSYAVTLLGRLSCALAGVMDQSVLLAYLSLCSRFTVASTSENFEGEKLDFNLKDSYINFSEKGDEILEPKKDTISDYLLNANVKASTCIEIVFQKVVDLWPLIYLRCMTEVVQTLRTWKEELRSFSSESRQCAGVLVFASKYLNVIKLLGKAWDCYFSLQFKGMGFLEPLLSKMEIELKEMLYRFSGLSGEGKLHILELMLLTYVMRLSYRGTCCFEDYMKKVNLVLCRVVFLQKEGSIKLSNFVTELQSIMSRENGESEDGFIHKLDLLHKSLHLYSLKYVLFPGQLKYLQADVNVCDNDFQNPFPFISGLPVGLPLDVTLYNISNETRLWVAITLGKKSTHFVFLDLNEFGGCDAMRKFTFVAPFFRTPKAKHFVLKVSIAMECLSEDQHFFKHCNGPKHELMHLCKEKEVYLSTAVK